MTAYVARPCARLKVSLLGVLAAAFAAAAAAAAEADDVFIFDDASALPETVAAETGCAEDGPGYATRRPFAGGFVFTVQCPGNNANFVEALVFATGVDGAGARLLTFPVPGKPEAGFNPEEELSNADFFAASSEISEILVDPEPGPGWCRSEARWRLTGVSPVALLIFFRHTRDCDGKGGWSVVTDKRRKK